MTLAVDPTQERILAVPAAGMTVLDPATMQPLPVDGLAVSNSVYWQRRLGDGDITGGEPVDSLE